MDTSGELWTRTRVSGSPGGGWEDWEIWLVVNKGGTNAQFKGPGTINGRGDYRFMIWAGDGESDTFRIRIQEEDALGNETVIYGNGFDQAIGRGSIVIHTRKGNL